MARSDYTLAVFDEHGQEQKDEHGDLGSQKAAARLQNDGITDVFIMSHGWKGDVPSSIEQYNSWTDAMLACTDDIARMRALRPGFKPLMIGFHWPSLPWGDESAVASFGFDGTAAAPAFVPVQDYAIRLGGTPEIEAAVQNVFNAMAATPDPNVMTPELTQAYLKLDQVLNLPAQGAAAAPAGDRLPFNPQGVFAAAREDVGGIANFSGFGWGDLLSPLRTLSFWAMKGRAQKLGESAGAAMLAGLQNAARGRDVRFHLMGHSFGCIVVSGMLAGPRDGSPAPEPVESAVLVQGALSLWSFSPKIEKAMGMAGYFNPVLAQHKVLGPIATTQSQFDSAVGKFYPIAAGLAGQVSFDALDLPLFGGVGTFGIQGVAGVNQLPSMLPVTTPYPFQAGQVYNIQSDNIVKKLDGISGAHSDIAHPEVGHVVWQAAMTSF